MTAIGQRSWSRFVRLTKPYLTSESRREAIGLLALLLGLLLALSGLNVVNSYVGRDFMTAIAGRQSHWVYRLALAYLGVFVASTAAGAFSRYVELLLGLRWREWLTRYFFQRYLFRHAYCRLNAHPEVDNPDQRIAEDIRTFTTTTLSFLVLVSNSVITIVAFTGVLWRITPWLLAAAVLYPLLGTSLIVFVGRGLVRLNYLQLKKEANFRFELVHVRENAEAIALVHAEAKEEARLGDRLGALIANYRSIIGVLLNLKLVTGGYNYLTQLIPVLIVAPLYLRGEVEFGVVPQAAMAFSQVFNAFSLIAEEFQDLSTYAAVIGRLGSLQEAVQEAAEPARRAIQVIEADAHVAYQQVTLRAAEGERVLVRDLTLEIPRGRRTLVTGPNNLAPSALFRATAGLWNRGSGRIVRPVAGRVLFLPERPYMVPGTLRDQFIAIAADRVHSDEELLAVLGKVRLQGLVDRLGGLDVGSNWETALSLKEQQVIAFAHLLLAEPDFAFLDNAASALSEPHEAEVYQLVARTAVTDVSTGARRPSLLAAHDVVLELRRDGSWAVSPISAQRDRTG